MGTGSTGKKQLSAIDAENIRIDEAEFLIARLMMWAFTAEISTACRIMLGRFIGDIQPASSEFRAVYSAFMFYWDSMRFADDPIDNCAVHDLALAMGCPQDYLDSCLGSSLIFSGEIVHAVEVLTGMIIDIPDAEMWNERMAIIRFG